MVSYYWIGRSLLCSLVIMICTAVAGVLTYPSTPNVDQVKAAKIQFTPCKVPNVLEELKCGKLEVFEDRDAKTGRKIALNILFMPAKTDKPASDPVFFLAGGPGQSIVSVMPVARRDLLDKIRRERDVVLVDQRGTGGSNPLNCVLYADKDNMTRFFGDTFPLDTIRACRENLEKVADLTKYTTDIAMDDLDDVRAALGYDKINIHGGSYGTTAAFVYLRRHGDHVRTATLESVAPVNFKNPLPVAKALQHTMDRLFADCAADTKCNSTYPDLKTKYQKVLDHLSKEAMTFEVANPITKTSQQVTVTRTNFVDLMRPMIYSPEVAIYVPIIIQAAFLGDYGPFARLAYIYSRGLEEQIARGLYLSVNCAESVPFITEADIARETANTDSGDSRIRSAMKACQEWPKVKASPTFLNAVKSNVPVLIISGELDPVTEPALATEAAKYLPNSRQILIHNAGHSPASECTFNLVSEFISKGSAKGLDASCVDSINRPPFYVP